MIAEAFLTCALALPAANHTRPAISYSSAMKDEVEKLKDFIHKNNPDAEIFITPHGQRDKLHEYGWERVPFNWRGNEIWIQRKPKSDQKRMEESA